LASLSVTFSFVTIIKIMELHAIGQQSTVWWSLIKLNRYLFLEKSILSCYHVSTSPKIFNFSHWSTYRWNKITPPPQEADTCSPSRSPPKFTPHSSLHPYWSNLCPYLHLFYPFNFTFPLLFGLSSFSLHFPLLSLLYFSIFFPKWHQLIIPGGIFKYVHPCICFPTVCLFPYLKEFSLHQS
jgi:hypothetical protein